MTFKFTNLSTIDISRLQCQREKANTPSDSQENGESKDVNISFFFQNSEIATFSHPESHICKCGIYRTLRGTLPTRLRGREGAQPT